MTAKRLLVGIRLDELYVRSNTINMDKTLLVFSVKFKQQQQDAPATKVKHIHSESNTYLIYDSV